MCHPPSPEEVRRLKRISSRIMRAVRSERYLNPARLRVAVVEIAADIELMVQGVPVPDELCADTARSSVDERPTLPAPPPDFFEVDVESGAASPAVPVLRPSGGP